MQFGRVVVHELRVLRADRSLYWISALFTALCLIALRNGLAHSNARDRAAADTQAQERAAHDTVVATWRDVMSGREAPDPWANPTDPSLVGGGLAVRYAVLPTAPLAPLAVGQSDMLPDTYRVTTQSRVEFMYDSEIENPWNLLTGSFDLAFVLTYLLPLFIFAWTYNLLAIEREQGTLRMLLSQPIGVRTITAGKLAARAVFLLAWAIAMPAATILASRPEARDGSGILLLGGWAGLIATYAVFWFSLSVLVDSFAKSSALNALILVSSWVVLVLVVPVALNLLAARVSPVPSRTELATQTRLITIDNLNRLADRFGTDYRHVNDPQLLLPKNGRFQVPERLRAMFLANRELDAQLEDALAAFDRQLAGQQAIVDRLGSLSPAILLHEGMAAIAGTGTARYQRFQTQVKRFHESWKRFFLPRILDGIAITEADFAHMPRWSWREEDERALRNDTSRRLVQLLLVSAVFCLIAWWKLGRYPVA